MRGQWFVWMIPLLLAADTAAADDTAAMADKMSVARNRMVDEEIVAAGVKNPRVINAMRATPRHEFVPVARRQDSYFDTALPIGESQTISPPFVVAFMTEQLEPKPTDKVLEIGTGSGYQAAVLSPLVSEVYTIEIVRSLGERAARTLKRLKYKNVHPKVGDGYAGWPEHAPFDKIIVTCSPEQVPPKLVEQLREGGRMVVPVGERYRQMLYLFEKRQGKLEQVALIPTLFVPMTGQAEAGRVIKPDPEHPTIANGGFEETIDATSDADAKTDLAVGKSTKVGGGDQNADVASATPPRKPSAWHYQRGLKLVESEQAPEGKHFVEFRSDDPARASRALQGMAVDGRKVHELEVSLWVRARNAQPGTPGDPAPGLWILFYDGRRTELSHTWVGPWHGTFDWKLGTDRVKVPPAAREAIVRVGLDGATGEIAVDDVRIRAVNEK